VSDRRRILYIDDEAVMVRLMTAQLEGSGVSVRGFTVPEDGIAAFSEDPSAFDLVITDYNMPRLSGFDVAAELCRLRPDVPVLVITGYITDELRDKVSESGARGIIYKPNSVRDLLAAIDSALAT